MNRADFIRYKLENKLNLTNDVEYIKKLVISFEEKMKDYYKAEFIKSQNTFMELFERKEKVFDNTFYNYQNNKNVISKSLKYDIKLK